MTRWIVSAGWLLAGFTQPVSADIVVNTTADQYGSDAGHCSLREAVRAANSDTAYGGCTAGNGFDQINLANGTYLLTRSGRGEDANSTGDLDISEGVQIGGNAAATTIIDAGGLDRIFHVQQGSSAILSLALMTLRGGDPVGSSNADDIYGGAVYADGNGDLRLSNVHVTGNLAVDGGGVFADSAAGDLEIKASAFSANSAVGSGGSTGSGGAVASRRLLTASDSTFSGNLAACVGSAIYFSSSSVENVLASVTVADNHSLHATCIPGPALWNGSPTASVRVRNSIVARNYSGFEAVDCNDIVSDDYNLIGTDNGCDIEGAIANTLTNVDPDLMPLFDYGGGTPSHMILPGSAAIGGGNPGAPGGGGSACSSTDQRGVVRTDCDIGAYEYRATFTVNRENDAADATPGNGQCDATGGGCTLRAAIAEANESDEPTTIAMPTGTYRLTLPIVPNQDSGDLKLAPADGLTIVGAGAGLTTVQGDGNDDQMFQLFSGANSLARFSVRGGNEHGQVSAGGVDVLNSPALLADLEIAGNAGCSGGLTVRDHLIAERVSIHDNLADVAAGCPFNGGGVLVDQNGVLDMRNSTISGNRSREGGGGLFVDGGTARLSHVTIANNRSDYTGTASEGGGGIGRGISGTVFLKDSIVANNSSGNGIGPDCAALLQSQDFNLIENTDDCTIGGESGNNISGVDPGLTALGTFGGMLPVHALRPDSPALDGIGGATTLERESACRDGMQRSVVEDQRGVARPQGSFCDIGAFEGSVDLIFADGFDTTP